MQILAPLAAALTATVLLAALVRWSNILLDRPNERSLHHAPIPRVGGITILPAIALSWTLLPDVVPQTIWVPAAFLFGLSLLDDSLSMPIPLRLIAHLTCAGYLAIVIVVPQSGPVAGLAAALAVAWMTNLYNFMDGSDGLAGGMTLIGFSGYTIAASTGGDFAFATACFAVAAASLPFLFWNFHPAKIFLGDSGSIPLGFLAAALGAEGWRRNLWPIWFPLIVFSPFIVDATVTLLRRVLRREKVWRAHREHYYQRLVQLGLGHRGTALAEYALMFLCALAALIALQQPVGARMTIFGLCALLYLTLALCIDRAWHRREPQT
jgi:UDP-N-acetylmuramyl pentapeptide phosphotransferase/UDP-N-acetylglucosamine-1-phosphate transferase